VLYVRSTSFTDSCKIERIAMRDEIYFPRSQLTIRPKVALQSFILCT
jgi:hypothetical protein